MKAIVYTKYDPEKKHVVRHTTVGMFALGTSDIRAWDVRLGHPAPNAHPFHTEPVRAPHFRAAM